MRIPIILAAAVAAFSQAPATHAQVLASSNFTTGDEGWRNGDFDGLGGTSPVIYNAAAGTISAEDNYFFSGFVAPSAFLGNQAAAFGGTFSFDIMVQSASDIYSPLALIGAGLTLFANPSVAPTTTMMPYSITLTGANFNIGSAGNPSGGILATDAQLLSVLSALDRIAIDADWAFGYDFVTLDNVVLRAGAVSAVPEPATWGMMILGFAVLGGSLRRQRGAARGTGRLLRTAAI